ncbi:MAG TPA: AsmA family protein [Candidatus Acidoferrum sp.]|nr:AsmA family protein [Candidatus Acidoferrum sp.]
MRRALRVLLILVVVVVVLVLVVPFLIPVNQFRPIIEQKASAALGRKVEVGNLSLSLFTGSLSADNLSIADDPKFNSAPFLTAKSIKVGVELLPLIVRKDLNITGIVIDSPEVTLLRDPGGDWNYSSFAASSAKSEAATTPASQPQSAAPSASSPSTAAEFSVEKLELRDGRVVIGSTNSQKRSTYDKVEVTASNVSLTTKFPVTLSANLPGGGDLKVDGTAGPLDQQNTALTPVNAKLTINNLNLATTGFLDPSAGLGGLLDLNSALASQNGEATVSGNAKLSKALLIAGGSPSAIPVTVDFNTKYDLRKNRGVLDPSTLKIGNATAHLSGTYEVPADSDAVTLHIKVNGQNMPAKDLETFLPALGIHMPSGASLQAGSLNTNLDLNGPTSKLVTSGNVGLFNAKLAGFDLGSKLAAISKLVGINTGKDLDIEKMTTDLHMAPTGLEAQNFQALVPSLGTLVGNGTIDAKNNLDFKMAATLKNAIGGAAGAVGGAASGAASNAIGGLLGKVTGSASGAAGGLLGNCKNASGGSGPTLPFQIKGTTSNPSFIPDVGGVAAGMLKSQLGCFGGGSQAKTAAQPQQNPNNPIDAIGGLFKKKKP